MPEQPRFLLGYGERLTERVWRNSGGGPKDLAYTPDEARLRLAPQALAAIDELDRLPRAACPDGESVEVVTLHPEWLAKSYFPERLLDEYRLRSVGSRPTSVVPEKTSKDDHPTQPLRTTDIFVAGQRSAFRAFADSLAARLPTQRAVAEQLPRLEAIRAPQLDDRLRVPNPKRRQAPYEVVLHASALRPSSFILEAFEQFALSVDADPDMDRALFAGGLCYLPVHANPVSLNQLSAFSFVRIIRPIPSLRMVHPIERSFGPPAGQPSPPPTEDPVDPDLRIAVFDGGLLKDTVVDRWASEHEALGVGASVNEALDHGTKVTSALLFGSLTPGQPAPRPYGVVDNYRVVDDVCLSSPLELYDVLRRIENVLAERRHEFVNMSLGPSCAIEDDEVHTWTAVLDQHLADGATLATLAVGNTGDLDHVSGNARIQVPSDSVNGLCIGASDSRRRDWSRASYSSIGPGRRPGVVKPDILAFGGSAQEPFYVFATSKPNAIPTAGTSFASPAALRVAAGVRAHFGSRISPLALKALLIHAAQNHASGPVHTGWGKIPEDVEELVVCPDGVARVVYQGELTPSQILRAPIPLPDVSLPGKTTIAATITYATPTDPQDPGSYTRAGLDVSFRPNSQDFYKDSTTPKSVPFFLSGDYASEEERRRKGYKWETVLHRSHNFRRSLNDPAFEIHYVPREGGGSGSTAERIRYALVVTVSNRRITDLYDQVLRKYATYLEPMVPIVEVPIRVS